MFFRTISCTKPLYSRCIYSCSVSVLSLRSPTSWAASRRTGNVGDLRRSWTNSTNIKFSICESTTRMLGVATSHQNAWWSIDCWCNSRYALAVSTFRWPWNGADLVHIAQRKILHLWNYHTYCHRVCMGVAKSHQSAWRPMDWCKSSAWKKSNCRLSSE